MSAELWSKIRDLVEEKHAEAVCLAKRKEIALACTVACIPIYREHGDKHPAEFGAMEPVGSQEANLENLKMEIAEWEACLQLIDAQSSPEDDCVVVKATAR